MEFAGFVFIYFLMLLLLFVLNIFSGYSANENYLMLLILCLFIGPTFGAWREWREQKRWPSLLSKQDYWIMFGLTALAFSLRVFNLEWRMVWIDEDVQAVSAFKAGPIFEASRQQQPPLNYVLQTLVMRYLGFTPWTVRLQSLIFGTLSVPLFYILLRNIKLKTPSVIFGCLLMIFSWSLIYYSQEGRPYSAGVFSAILLLNFSWVFISKEFNWIRCGILVGLQLNFFFTLGFQPEVYSLAVALSAAPFYLTNIDSKLGKKYFWYWASMVLAGALTIPFLMLDAKASMTKFFNIQPSDMIQRVLAASPLKISRSLIELLIGKTDFLVQSLLLGVIALGCVISFFEWRRRPLAAAVSLFLIFFNLVFAYSYFTLINYPFQSR